MKPSYNKKLIQSARTLRKNATPQENHLWYDFLHAYPVRFRRQRPVGQYIVDFYCEEAKLVIEIDGSQHYEDSGMESDAERTAALNKLGLEVIRFSNREVNTEFDGVCEHIHNVVQMRIGRNPYELLPESVSE